MEFIENNDRITIAVNGTTVRVAGEIDMSSRAALAQAVGRVPEDRQIGFDLLDVRFIDSAGLAALLDTTRRPGGVVLTAVSDPIRFLIKMSGTSDLFLDRGA